MQIYLLQNVSTGQSAKARHARMLFLNTKQVTYVTRPSCMPFQIYRPYSSLIRKNLLPAWDISISAKPSVNQPVKKLEYEK